MTDADQGRVILDLEERVRELETRLSASEAAASFLDSVLRAVPAFVINVDPSLRIRYMNRYQVGFTAEDTVGHHIRDFLAADDHPKALEQVERARETGKITTFATTNAAGPNGAPTSYVTYVAPVREPDGSVGVCLAAVDVGEELARKRALRESEEKLRLAIEATGLGVWTWDLRTQEVTWDDNMKRIHGGVQARDVEHYIQTIVHPDDRERVLRDSQATRRSGKLSSQVTHRVQWPDGTVRWVLTLGRMQLGEDGRPSMVIGGSLDVTRNYELEEQLRQSQKMEAVGSLTAGIAHNFNNMLAVILPTLEVATELVPPARVELLRQASHAATRASELVRQLMTYAGQSRGLHQRVCNVATLAESAVGICRRTLEPHIEVSLEIDADARHLNVEGNAVQLEHVIVNLVLNARDAIVEAARVQGVLRVHVRKAPEPLRSKQGGDEEAVCIDVRDNGTGIAEHLRMRIFEPFFTTKPAGKGTGLGLATSFGTIRDHGGTLVCSSHGAEGAEFSVTLPLSGGPIPAPSLPTPVDDVPVGTRVLLVDDDAAVRGALGHVLMSAGLRVHEAHCGHSALTELKACPQIEVVLLDRAMPGGAGEQFVPRMRELAPDARLVFLSGQAIEPKLEGMVDAVILKPVSSPNLLRTIRQVLERASR